MDDAGADTSARRRSGRACACQLVFICTIKAGRRGVAQRSGHSEWRCLVNRLTRSEWRAKVSNTQGTLWCFSFCVPCVRPCRLLAGRTVRRQKVTRPILYFALLLSLSMRRATHAQAGWYETDKTVLQGQLKSWLAAADQPTDSAVPRALIVPHAGYSYSGPTAAWGYKHIDGLTSVKRVFILGPSHHWHTRRCALSRATAYRTPLGDVPVDVQMIAELHASGLFDSMTMAVDEAEHSLEMHVPYLQHCLGASPFKLVPVMVGSLSAESESLYGRLLSAYFCEPGTLFVCSTDFCHWGARFHYTPHDKAAGPPHAFVEAMDREGMRLIEAGVPEAFGAYLRRTQNTICGRHPIGVLMYALQSANGGASLSTRFTRYAQSSRAVTLADSSVSYASAFVT